MNDTQHLAVPRILTAPPRRPCTPWGGLAVVLALLLAAVPNVQAVGLSWVGGDGWWDDPTNWSPTGVPATGDDVSLSQPGSHVAYANSAGASVTLGTVTIQGGATLYQDQDTFSAGGEYIIDGAVVQTGGNHNATGDLILGSQGGVAGELGSYELHGGNLDVTGSIELIERNGSFRQTGGIHNTPLMIVNGSYSLAAGSLTAGTLGVMPGSFEFTGGSLSVQTFGGGELRNAGGRLVVQNSTRIGGDYTEVPGTGARTEFDIGGVLTSEYDILDVAGTYRGGKEIYVSFSNGFIPSLGDVFDIITADTIVGVAGTGTGFFLGGTNLYVRPEVILDPSGPDIFRVRVTDAVPEPLSLVLVGSTFVVLMGLRRRWA